MISKLIYNSIDNSIDNNIKNILLIDGTIEDPQFVFDSVSINTFPIIYSSKSTKDDLLKVLLQFKQLDRLCFFFKSK